MNEKLKAWLKPIYHQLIEINDTPLRKALGLGLGVFLGIFPGMGPIAALVGSYLLRVNRAAALLGSLLTNTWLSLVTLALAVKVGAVVTGQSGELLKASWDQFARNFSLKRLFERETLELIYPILIGFSLVSLLIGLCVAGAAYLILIKQKKKG